MSMDIGAALSAGVATDPAAQAKARAEAGAQERQALIEEIRDKGFRAYVEDLEKKKLEELRKKILGAMGLTEEALAKMSPDQRAAVEKAVAEEIQRRLEAGRLAGRDLEETMDGPADASLQPGFARFDTTLIQALQEARDPANDAGPEREKALFG